MWPFKKKDEHFPDLEEELLLLCREWFSGQIGDLPEEELPPPEEVESDVIGMRDRTYGRVTAAVPSKKFLSAANTPGDEENRRVLISLTEAYAGHERTTPIFVRLALSKVDEPRYQSGWPLCTLRVIAEAYLEQSTTPL